MNLRESEESDDAACQMVKTFQHIQKKNGEETAEIIETSYKVFNVN